MFSQEEWTFNVTRFKVINQLTFSWALSLAPAGSEWEAIILPGFFPA